MKGWVWTVLMPVLLADQCIKIWVKLNFSLGESMSLIPGLIELQFIENEGMAFGWALPGAAGKLVLTSFRLVAAVGIGFYMKRLVAARAHKGFLTCLAFIWAGAIGNIIDSALYGQLFTASHWGMLAEWAGEGYAPFFMGYVVDMFHFTVRWPSGFPIESLASREVFPPIWNVADAAISCGVIAILIGQRTFFAEDSAGSEENPSSPEPS